MAVASGKVILFGEHSVVYGSPAIAAGLPRGITARVVDGEASRLLVPAWALDARPGDGSRVGEAFGRLLAGLPRWARHKTVELTPQIPAGAGLGSSAAMAVAIARALAEGAGEELDGDRLFDAAMEAERVFHQNPSGVDVACAAHGGLIRFVKGLPPKLEPIMVLGEAVLVVAKAEAGADTAEMVDGVRARRNRLPHTMGATLSAFTALVDEAHAALQAGNMALVGELMDINHGLLTAIGVSTPQLDAACHRARSAGAFGAKLTGAGGGGSVVALVAPDRVSDVTNALSDGGADPFVAAIGDGPVGA